MERIDSFVPRAWMIIWLALFILAPACTKRVSAPRPRVTCDQCRAGQVKLGSRIVARATWAASCRGAMFDPDFDMARGGTGTPSYSDCDDKPFRAAAACTSPCEIEVEPSYRGGPMRFYIRPVQLGPFSFQVELVRTDNQQRHVYRSRELLVSGPDELQMKCLDLRSRRQRFGADAERLMDRFWVHEFRKCDAATLAATHPLFIVYALDGPASCGQCRRMVLDHLIVNGERLHATHDLESSGRDADPFAFSLADAFPEHRQGTGLAPGEYQVQVEYQGTTLSQTISVK